MPSIAYRRWITIRKAALDEIERAHGAVGGTGRGRRYATQQLNHAYVVLLASNFQGFCRDLHSECAARLVAAIPLSPDLRFIFQGALTKARQLDRGNAQKESIGNDFGRFGVAFWKDVESHKPRNATRKDDLTRLNEWRNAIAHENFDPAKLGGVAKLQLAQVKRWRSACEGLARSFDAVMRSHIRSLTGAPPW